MRTFNILVVDDEPLVVRALSRLLKREGFTVEVAHSGEEALLKLEHFAPDIILSDFRMPGMTGSELMKEVKRRHPQALRLLLSGYADCKSVVDSLNAGEICRCLDKPWDDVELVTYLRGLLRSRGMLERLERQGGTRSPEPEVGGPQRLPVELPVRDTPSSPMRRRQGEA